MSLPNPFAKKEDDAEATEATEHKGVARKSAASAKPARAAAQGVRVVSSTGKVKKSAAPLTKEERKERRRAQREEEDQVASVSNLLMKREPEYKKNQRIWWVLLGGGFAVVLVSFFLSSAAGDAGSSYDVSTPLGLASVVTLVVAYAMIIGALIWEFRKMRPLRNAAMIKAKSMSAKKRQAVFEEEYEADEKRRAEKAARKAAKKK